MNFSRLRAAYGINTLRIVEVLNRAQAMYNGLAADQTTYANPTLPLSDFQGLIVDLGAAQQAVATRVLGAAEKREVQRGLLLTGMGTERMFVQALANANPGRAAALITGAGLVVATIPVRIKALLTLRHAKQSGGVTCEAYVDLLVGAGAKHPKAHLYFNWQYTLDGGKTFITLPSTTRGKTLIQGLTPLATVGVRVSLTNDEGPAEWSQLVTILVL